MCRKVYGCCRNFKGSFTSSLEDPINYVHVPFRFLNLEFHKWTGHHLCDKHTKPVSQSWWFFNSVCLTLAFSILRDILIILTSPNINFLFKWRDLLIFPSAPFQSSPCCWRDFHSQEIPHHPIVRLSKTYQLLIPNLIPLLYSFWDFFLPVLLRYTCHTVLCKFNVYSMMIRFTCILRISLVNIHHLI